MTNQVQQSQRMILILVFACLALMLAAAAIQRLSGAPLVKQTAQIMPTQSGISGMTSPPENMAGTIAGVMSNLSEESRAVMLEIMRRLSENPHDVDALLDLSSFFLQSGNTEVAVNYVNRALIAAPGDWRPSFQQGLLLVSIGDYAGAAQYLERSLSLRDMPTTLYRLALLYIDYLDQREKGLKYLQMVLKDPNLPQSIRDRIEAELVR